MSEQELDLADDAQDPQEGPEEAADAAEEQIKPGEPGYIKSRLERRTRQRDAARQEAERLKGELAAYKERATTLEARVAQPAQPAAPTEDPIAKDLQKAQNFVSAVEELRNIVLLEADEDRVAKAKVQLARVKPDDIAFAHAEIARCQGLKAASESEKKISTHLQGQSAQTAFQERVKQRFGASAVVRGTPDFEAAIAEYRELIKDFPDDTSGAVTWMAYERAEAKKNRAGRGTSEQDRRRLAIEAGTRRESHGANQIAALEARGDPTSLGKAVEMKLDAFLRERFGGR